jgi:glycosyltransferase involved in cell wall biosynthesis
MKISAIIPVFNAEKYLARAVQSLLDTKYPDLEIIIVDDGSSDASVEVARQLAGANSEVAVFRHEDGGNHGVSATRNLGLAKCQGDLICFLDADDYVFPHRFDISATLLKSNQQIDGVHELAVMEFEGERSKNRFWDENDLFGIRAPSEAAATIDLLLRGSCWPTSGILFRRKLLERTGLFPERYRFAEDYHLWLRMACVSTIVPGNSTQPVSVYFRHGNNAYQGGLERKNDMIRAMTEVYRWLGNNPEARVGNAVFAKSVCNYIRNALIRSREEGRCDIGRKIVRTVLSNMFFPALHGTELIRQSFYVAVGRSAA